MEMETCRKERMVIMERYKDEFGAVLGVGSSKPANGSIATVAEIALDDARIAEANKPKEVTKLQMQKAMKEFLLWNDFKLMRASDVGLDDYWLDALNVYRYDPMVLSMGKTDVELDALFLLASTK